MSGEFTEHADEERQHAMWAAERITQLGGDPDFNPATLTERAHTAYETAPARPPGGDCRSLMLARKIADGPLGYPAWH